MTATATSATGGLLIAQQVARELLDAHKRIRELEAEVAAANADWKRMNAQRKRANRQAQRQRERAKGLEAELEESSRENALLAAALDRLDREGKR